jgi:hypothetical protein
MSDKDQQHGEPVAEAGGGGNRTRPPETICGDEPEDQRHRLERLRQEQDRRMMTYQLRELRRL